MRRTATHSYLYPVESSRPPICRTAGCSSPAEPGPLGTCADCTQEQVSRRLRAMGSEEIPPVQGRSPAAREREKLRKRAQRQQRDSVAGGRYDG